MSVLAGSQINYTLTHFAEHSEQFGHDAVNRYLAGDQIRPRLVWENVKAQVVQISEGCVVFDDTVVDKDFSFKIDLVRRQYSGNEHAVNKSIGVVTVSLPAAAHTGRIRGLLRSPGVRVKLELTSYRR